MIPESGSTLSVWSAKNKIAEYPALTENIQTDICIVGGGITGLTTAYLLAKEGKEVILIEDGNLASGESSRTTAHITNVIDDRFFEMEKMHGENGLKLLYESETAGILKIKSIIESEHIDCDFSIVDGYLFFMPDDSAEKLEDEYYASQRAGAKVELVTKAPFKDFNTGPCLKYTEQAQFDIIKYLNGLAQAFVNAGGKIFTHTHIQKIEEDSNVTLTTDTNITITASFAVAATNSPISNYVSIHLKQAAYRTYVVAGKIPKGYVPKALYWDTNDPYHYIRIDEEPDCDLLIIGGEDHKTGQDENIDDRHSALEAWTRERFPEMTDILYKWSGQVLEPLDGISFIGLDPESKGKVYISTGDSGMGITHGTYSAIILTDQIMGRENRWSKIYDPSRVKTSAFFNFIKEGVNTAAQLKDFITPGDINSTSELQIEEGAIIRRGLHKIAVYKDKEENIHEFSALCPHLKCILQWNKLEKSWDCPCHGSRFDAMGKVINGPALTNMQPVNNIN